MVVCAAYGIAFFFATLFQCRPISMWQPRLVKLWLTRGHRLHVAAMAQRGAGTMQQFPSAGLDRGRCFEYDLRAAFQTWLTLAVVLDLVILALPLPQLYGLELSLQKRISIMLMFAVGWFACIIAIIRLKYLVQFRSTENPTCRSWPTGMFSNANVTSRLLRSGILVVGRMSSGNHLRYVFEVPL